MGKLRPGTVVPQDLSVWRGRFNQEPASSPPKALCSALASPRRGHTPPTRPRRPPAAPHRTAPHPLRPLGPAPAELQGRAPLPSRGRRWHCEPGLSRRRETAARAGAGMGVGGDASGRPGREISPPPPTRRGFKRPLYLLHPQWFRHSGGDPRRDPPVETFFAKTDFVLRCK